MVGILSDLIEALIYFPALTRLVEKYPGDAKSSGDPVLLYLNRKCCPKTIKQTIRKDMA